MYGLPKTRSTVVWSAVVWIEKNQDKPLLMASASFPHQLHGRKQEINTFSWHLHHGGKQNIHFIMASASFQGKHQVGMLLYTGLSAAWLPMEVLFPVYRLEEGGAF